MHTACPWPPHHHHPILQHTCAHYAKSHDMFVTLSASPRHAHHRHSTPPPTHYNARPCHRPSPASMATCAAPNITPLPAEPCPAPHQRHHAATCLLPPRHPVTNSAHHRPRSGHHGRRHPRPRRRQRTSSTPMTTPSFSMAHHQVPRAHPDAATHHSTPITTTPNITVWASSLDHCSFQLSSPPASPPLLAWSIAADQWPENVTPTATPRHHATTPPTLRRSHQTPPTHATTTPPRHQPPRRHDALRHQLTTNYY